MRQVLTSAVLLSLLVAPEATAQAAPSGPEALSGHSAHGGAFDEGPRQKPWKMEGIGETHFPVTTAVPEVQEWFDQGNTLLHSFWWFEAERSFRWCLKLDPDCAMAYWGLARATGRGWEEADRLKEFLKEAVRRKNAVTERERLFIEAWEKAYLPEIARVVEPSQSPEQQTFKILADELEMIILRYPHDEEAKALFVLYSLYRSSRYGNEAVLAEILREHPLHPGAHHYRIHNWDGKDGAQALDSCEQYGRIAGYSGHANHMPGHIYSGIGMWHEGAIWMDSATRTEKRYMEKRMILPFHNWNYAHNRNYLSYIQEQLGLPTLARDGARQLLAAPLDPKFNSTTKEYSIYREGIRALVRGLVKFEEWETLLEPDAIPWRDVVEDDLWRAYSEGLAHLGLANLEKAMESLVKIGDLTKKVEEDKTPGRRGGLGRVQARMLKDLGGRIELARGNDVDGIRLLGEAAREQWENFREENDPPVYPQLLYTVLGESYLQRESAGMAVSCFRKTLEVNPNDAFALSGLARALESVGDRDGAAEALGKLRAVWSDAEAGLRWMNELRDLQVSVPALDDSPRRQRAYRDQTLDELGPQTWRPYAAPSLDALDSGRERVTLDEVRGKNVLLVFYLGEECAHCVEQLHAIGEKAGAFASRNVELLAISSSTPEQHKESLKLGELPFRLLADPGHENARRFHSYDDFEEMELHSTILVDGSGKIRWTRTGGDPFMELDFLLAEIDRVNRGEDLVGAATEAAKAGSD
jgi:peroxiredoxin